MNTQIIAQHLDRLRALGSIDVSQVSNRLYRKDISAAESSYILSKAYLLANQFSACADLASISLCLHPGAPQPWYMLGAALSRQGDPQGGFRFGIRSVVLIPLASEFCAGAGVMALDSQQTVVAESLLRRAICLDPSSPAYHLDLGVALDRQNDTAKALILFEREAVLSPLNPAPYFNSGNAQMALGNPERSAALYQQAISLGLNSQLIIISSALAHLVIGDFANGWRLYEARLAGENVISHGKNLYEISKKTPFKATQNEAHSTVLVWAEQGVGDEVMFGSMLGEFRGMVGKLLVQLDRRLIPLFRRSLPDDVEFFERGTVVPEDRYDSHIAIGSLGQYLRPTLESFAGKGGKYLWADPDRVQAMREWLSVREGERVIGLSWRSSNPETGAARSLALSDLVKSLQAPGVRFVNLQYGDVAAEIEALERDEGIEVLQCPGLDTTDDLDGLAALIEACDEVVSIGNATAHLAGALGKKTTVLLPKAPSWRWLLSGSETPWYRSVMIDRTIA
jgi:tetratricopeptide (TPR) repeat protein